MSDASGVVWEDNPPAPAPSGGSQGVVWEDQGQGVQNEAPVAEDPRATIGNAALQGAKKVIVGLPSALNPVPQTTTEKAGVLLGSPAPLTRMVTGVISGLGGGGQVPGAIQDINTAPNAGQIYRQVAGETAGEVLTQAAIAKGAEVVGGIDPGAAGEAAVDTAKAAGRELLPKSVKETLKFKERYDAARGRSGSSAGTPEQTGSGTSPANTGSRTSPGTAASHEPITDPAILKARLDEILKPSESALKTSTDVPKKGTAEAKPAAAPKAKSPATTQKITDESQALRSRQAEVGTEQGNKPLDPEADLSEPLQKTLDVINKFRKHGKAILSDETGSAGAPGTVDYMRAQDGGIEDVKKMPVMAEMTREVPARGFLNKVGTTESSVERTDAQIGKDTHSSIKFHQEAYRKGTMQTPELHVDEQGNVIGADGRHRAIAAIREGGPNAKIKVRVVQHPFQGISR